MLLKRKLYSLASRVGAFPIFPDPIAKAILQLLLFFARGNCFRLIYDAVSVRVLIIGCRCAAVQRLLDQLGRTEAGSAVSRRIIDDVLCGVVQLDGPGRDRFRVSDFHASRQVHLITR